MLELKISIRDNKLYCIHFRVFESEIKKYIDTNEMEFDDEDSRDVFIKDYFENELFPLELEKRGIKPISPIDFRYFTDYSPNVPFMGVCRFISYDKAFDVSIPNEVDLEVEELINEDYSEVDERFDEMLLASGFYFEKAGSVVEKYAKIDYELRYLENGKVFNAVKGQHFDMFEDDDIDPNLFIGAKIGDEITLNEDLISICALIQNITNRIPFTPDNYEKHVIRQTFNILKISDFQSFKERFKEEYLLKATRDNYICNLIDKMVKLVNYDVSEEEIDFFDKIVSLPFEIEYDETKTRDEKKEIIKKKMMFYALSKKSQSAGIDNYDLLLKVQDSLGVLRMGRFATNEENIHEIDKISILDYCKNNNVKNINKDYK